MGITSINRDSPVPVYYQVATDLRTRIIHGEWGQNGQIPSENALVQQYGISRVTIRQALAELEKDGIIKRYRGKGAFVNENPSQFLHELKYSLVTGNYEPENGQQMCAEVLEIMRFPNTYKSVEQALELPEGSAVVYFKRLFYLDEKPIAIGKSWLPADLVPGLEKDGLINNSLTQTMTQRYHLNAVHVDDVLVTVRPTMSECSLLDAAYDSALLLVKGISRLDDGRPLEYSNTLWLGDRVRFHISLEKTNGRFVMQSAETDRTRLE